MLTDDLSTFAIIIIEYHSKRYKIVADRFRWLGKILFSKPFLGSRRGSEITLETSRNMPINNINKSKSFDFLGPPNLQLNLSSGQVSTRKETLKLFVAALVSLAVQISLLVIAFVVNFHHPTKRRLQSGLQPYGFPCYLIGSILLFIGMFICSFVIENSTIEFVWKRCSGGIREQDPATVESKRPRLIWLQRAQRVNDQTFGSFAILGGAKHHVLTSSRNEDVRICGHGKSHNQWVTKFAAALVRLHARMAEKRSQADSETTGSGGKVRLSLTL